MELYLYPGRVYPINEVYKNGSRVLTRPKVFRERVTHRGTPP